MQWSRLSLEEHFNVIFDELAIGAVRDNLSYTSTPVTWKLQLLPLEKAAVFVGSGKMTTDHVGPEVGFQLGKEEAMRFYASPMVLVGGIKRGLGWLQKRFDQVSWSPLELVLCSKPDIYQSCLSKQCIGISAARINLAQIQDILDDKCLTCGQARKTSIHLNRCPDMPYSTFQGECH